MPAPVTSGVVESVFGLQSVMSRKQETIILLIIIAVGVFTRRYDLGARSYWFDEMQTAVTAVQPGERLLDLALNQERKLPLFHIIMHAWLTVSHDEAWARLPAVFFGVLTIPFAYLLAREAAGRQKSRVALLTAAFVALSPALVWYSQQLRMYTALGCLSVLNMYFFLRAARALSTEGDEPGNDSRKMLTWFLVTGLFASLMHPFFALLAAGEAIAAFVWLLPKWDRALGLALVAVCAAGPGLALISIQSGDIGQAAGAFRPVRAGDIPNVFRHMALAFPRPYEGMPWQAAALIGAGVVVFGWLFVAGLAAYQAWRTKVSLLLFLFAPLCVMTVFSVTVWSFFNPRFLMNVYPVFALFVALGVFVLPRKGMRLIAVGLVVLLSVISLGCYFFDADYDTPHVRQAAEYLRGHANGLCIIHTSYDRYFSSVFYNDFNPDERLLSHGPLPFYRGGKMLEACPGRIVAIEDVVGRGEEFFLVLPDPTEPWLRYRRADDALSRFIDDNYEVLNREAFFGVVIYHVKRLR